MRKKVLIVDDESNIRRLVRLSLEDDDFEIFEAADGKEGFAKAQELKPDIIILDVMMPGLIGYRVCEEVRKDPALNQAYILFLSARDSQATELACREAGGNAFMSKPFDPEQLREHILKFGDEIRPGTRQ
jgi:DNA-binding response OmpR family regulator